MRRQRNNFSKETQRQALARSRKRCESALVPSLEDIGCNRPLRIGDFNYDHIQADANDGGNDLSNCAVLCRTCHSIKTREHDVPAIAQDKRVADLANGIRDPWKRKLPGGKQSPFKLKVGGGVVDRRTGEPWRPGK